MYKKPFKIKLEMKKTPMNNEYTIELTQFRSNYAKICDTSILAFASEKKATDVCLLQIILTFLLIASYSNLIFQIKNKSSCCFEFPLNFASYVRYVLN